MAIRFKSCLAALSLTALAACLLATPALADDDKEGAYVYVSGADTLAYNACNSAAIPGGTKCTSTSATFRAGYGYMFTPMWGLEASYGQFGYASTAGATTFPAPVGTGTYNWQLKANGLAIQAVVAIHMTDDSAIIGKFGIARVEYDESLDVMSTTTGAYTAFPTVHQARNNPALGLGLQFDLGPHGSLRLMAETFGSNNIYYIYGQNTVVRLVSASAALMWRY